MSAWLLVMCLTAKCDANVVLARHMASEQACANTKNIFEKVPAYKDAVMFCQRQGERT